MTRLLFKKSMLAEAKAIFPLAGEPVRQETPDEAV